MGTSWLLRLERAPRLVLLSVVLGVVGAAAAQAFLWMLHVAEALLYVPITGQHFLTVEETLSTSLDLAHLMPLWWVPAATTLGGLLSGLLVYSLAPEAEGDGTDAAIKAYHQLEGRIHPRIPLVKSIASAITIGSGGSAGREGPTSQIAAGIGALVARLLRLPPEERRALVCIGMVAGLSASFKSPLGTAIFGVEVLYSTMTFEAELLIYTIIGAAVSYALTVLAEGGTPLFFLPATFGFRHPAEFVWYALLGLCSGTAGALIPTVFYRVRDAFAALPVPRHVKPALGGLLLGLLAISLPGLLAGGYGWIQLAIDARLPLYLLLALAVGKLFALSLTLGSGGSGGVFAPSLYIGAMVGASLAAALHALTPLGPDPAAFAIVGMAATFAGAANVPVASMIMIAEMTGGYTLIMPAMLAVAVSFLVHKRLTGGARYPGLYQAQVRRFADSPAHHTEYSQAINELVRRGQLWLEEPLARVALEQRFERGESVPLGDGDDYIFRAKVADRAAVADRELRTIRFPAHFLVVAVERADGTVIPHGDAVLRPGDRLLIAATEQAMQAAESLLEKPASDPKAAPSAAQGPDA